MKFIVFLSPAHPLRGGIANTTERLAQTFQEKGYEVIIISFKLQYPGFLFPGKTQYTEDPAPEGLTILPLINSINPINWIRVGWKLRQLKPDLIIARYWLPFMGPSLGTILRIARWGNTLQTQVIADNIIPHEKRPGDRIFTQYFLGAIDACVVMSKSVAQDIRTFSTKKPIQFSYHPTFDNYGEKVSQETARTHLKLDPNGKYLLFFGFIRDYKGLDLLLRAMADPRMQDANIHLIIAGEYYGKQDFYEKMMRDLNILDYLVIHTHFIANDEIKYFFSAADLVVQPYKSATQSGISQIAYHFDTPMVVTKVGGLPEIVAHGKEGYVIDQDPDQIVTATLDFFGHQRKNEFEQAVAQKKQIFSWTSLMERIEHNYYHRNESNV